MNNPSEPVLSAAKLALAIRQLRAENPKVSLAGSEPIAIIGIGCRLPGGVASSEDYWHLLHHGVDAITTVPPDRWDADAYFDPDPQAPGKTNGRWGGWVSRPDEFDPAFFGISPREAVSIDPMQRLTLEVIWEALWDSGRAPSALGGSRSGVFLGIGNSDYMRLLFDDAAAVGPQSCSGGYQSVASGRASFLLNFRGPAVSIDTACSSSLVAVHTACQSLRAGTCDLAFAGGVSLHLLPEHYIGLAKLGMLAPDGRCKTFDSRADGFVPAEGCGVVMLKPLADALRDSDRIYAVIRGTAINQDGSTSVLTAPNGLAQRDVVRAALENAQIAPSNVSYVETHGTGTSLGDPIEVEALTEVLGARTPDSIPCALGAVKSTVGHLEAAAGVAGLIKAVLALDRQEIPPNLHFEKLNPLVTLEGTRFYLPAQPTPWRRGSRARFAGVSSFGFSGTNAHIVLEEAPQLPQRTAKSDAVSRKRFVLPISARTPEALKNYARLYRDFLADEKQTAGLEATCHSAATRRDHYEERLAVVANSREECREALGDFLNGVSRPDIVAGRASQEAEGVVFVFSGQGSQWPRMGMKLYEQDRVYRAVIEECDARIRKFANWSLIEQLAAPEDQSKLGHTEYAQPAIFAVEVALARLWQSWGVSPLAVVGHSAGEIAAAHIAGIFDLDEAIRVVTHRGRIMEPATGFGKMAAVHLPFSVVAERIQPFGEGVSIAAINSPKSTVIAGTPEVVVKLCEQWSESGIGCRMLPVDYAFHSAQMQPFSEELKRALGSVATKEQKVPVASTLRGAILTDAQQFDANYWAQNIRRPVLFADAVKAAVEMGGRTFLEIGPHPVLLNSIEECAEEGTPQILIPSLRRGKDDELTILSSLGKLYVSGVPFSWSSFYAKAAPYVSLPAYPYQRQRYWLDPRPKAKNDGPRDLSGVRLRSPGLRDTVYETKLDLAALPFLADHQIAGSVVLPMTAFLEIAGNAAAKSFGPEGALADVVVLNPLVLPETGECTVQTVVEGDAVRIFSLDGEEWKLHATCRICQTAEPDEMHSPSAAAANMEAIEPGTFYRQARERQLEFGSSFQVIESLRAAPGEAVGRIALHDREKKDARRYRWHPALLDGCLQVSIAAAPLVDGTYLPFSIERFETFATGCAAAWAMVRAATFSESKVATVDIDIVREDGRLLARLRGLQLKRCSATGSSKRTTYEVEWRKLALTAKSKSGAGRWLVISEAAAGAENLAATLRTLGCEAAVLKAGDSLEASGKIQGVVRIFDGSLRQNPSGPQSQSCKSALLLAQELLARYPADTPQLVLVTHGAVAVGPEDGCDAFWDSTVWGLSRTIALEHPELRSLRLDVDRAKADYAAIAREILFSDGEEEVALRDGQRFVPRLEPKFFEDPQPKRLVIPARGSIDNLATEEIERRAPKHGEVEAEVEASALNFRDVLNVLGMYPGDPGPLGVEFCGRIARIGEGVEGYQPGDRVMGIAWGSFASFVNTPAALITHVPRQLASVDAASIPNAFLTAHHCLVELGKIQRGERVLIHAATGGVGLAAVQIAQQAGAEIIATAGSEEKREYLRSLGIEHVFSSRTLDFASEIPRRTGGKGVDLVLNSLAGDFIAAGFEVLGRSGRFIEIGKTEIWSEERVAALGKSIRYFIVDLAIELNHEPELIQSHLSKISAQVAGGSLCPLPVRVFDFEDAPEAFRHMAQAKHMGKIVLRHPAPLGVSADATYLITGGLGALGLHSARWLVEQGARNLLLLGRSAPSLSASTKVAELRAAGVRVEIRSADVTQRGKLETVLREVTAAMPPLRGIIHSAGVLDDGVLTQQTWSRVEKVMAPKVAGAWNLHELTAHSPLDFFICFSSIASTTGSPAQSGYAAGNAFLDALAHYRNARGLRALTVNWGAWPDTGMAATVEAQGRRRGLAALRAMSEQDYLASLAQAAANGSVQVTIADVDWGKWEKPARMLSGLVRHVPAAQVPGPAPDILARLEKAPAANRRKILVDYLREQALEVLGLDKSHFIDQRQSLIRMGLDSLMAVEFRNRLVAAMKRSLTATLLFDYPNLARLAEYLDPHHSEPEPAADERTESLELLTDAQAEELLKAELGQNL